MQRHTPPGRCAEPCVGDCVGGYARRSGGVSQGRRNVERRRWQDRAGAGGPRDRARALRRVEPRRQLTPRGELPRPVSAKVNLSQLTPSALRGRRIVGHASEEVEEECGARGWGDADDPCVGGVEEQLAERRLVDRGLTPAAPPPFLLRKGCGVCWVPVFIQDLAESHMQGDKVVSPQVHGLRTTQRGRPPQVQDHSHLWPPLFGTANITAGCGQRAWTCRRRWHDLQLVCRR